MINGTTTDAPNNFATACGGKIATSGAVVYQFTVAAEASFVMTIVAASGSSLVPAVALRTTACSTDDSPPDCFELPMTSGGNAEQTVKVDLPAGTYWFIVSGLNGSNGAFTLTAQASTPVCGDGIVNSGEQCDEGTPWNANSGCNPPGGDAGPACQFTSNNQPCPGTAVIIAPNATNVLAASGYTTGYMDNYSQDCGTDGTVGAGAPDRAYVLTPTTSGMMTVTIGNEPGNTKAYCVDSNNNPTVDCWAYALYARSTCTDGTSVLACDQPVAGDAATITFPVTAATPVYVIVDGLESDMYSYGFFNLYVSLAP